MSLSQFLIIPNKEALLDFQQGFKLNLRRKVICGYALSP